MIRSITEVMERVTLGTLNNYYSLELVVMVGCDCTWDCESNGAVARMAGTSFLCGNA